MSQKDNTVLTSPEFEDTKLNIQVKRHFKKEEKGLLKRSINEYFILI